MVEDKTGLPIVRRLLERIVESPLHLITLETLRCDETVAQLRVLAMREGKSIYAWEPEVGLTSLRESGLNVPGSKRLTDALRYVMQSLHFGIYLFTRCADTMKPVDILLLRRISRMQTVNERKLVFIGSHVDMPEELDGMFERLAIDNELQPQLRLRDGRWVA